MNRTEGALEEWCPRPVRRAGHAGIKTRPALGEAVRHAQAALDLDDRDADVWVLLGRIHERRSETEASHRAFERALSLGVPGARARPYLAESAYAGRDFGRVRAELGCLGAAGSTGAAGGLGPVLDYWRGAA